MNLTFPSIPTESSASAPAASDNVAASGLGAVSQASAGFAALLAGAGDGTTSPQAGQSAAHAPAGEASVGAANPLGNGQTSQPILIAPWLAGAGLGAAAATLVAVAPGATVGGGEVSGAEEAAGSTAATAEGPTSRKTLLEEGDAQAIAVSLMQAMLGLAPPVVTGAPMAGRATQGSVAAGQGSGDDMLPIPGMPAMTARASITGLPGSTVGAGVPAASSAPGAAPVAGLSIDPFSAAATAAGCPGPAAAPGKPTNAVAAATAGIALPNAPKAPLPGGSLPVVSPLAAKDSASADSDDATVKNKPATLDLGAPADAARGPVGNPAAGLPAMRTMATPANLSLVAEKFAAAAGDVAVHVKAGNSIAIKNALDSASKPLAKLTLALGTDTAQAAAPMAAGSTLDRFTVSDPAVVHATAPTAPGTADATTTLPQVPQMSTAHRAVEAVMNATERFAARDQHSVNLQFTVGGSDLNVRVEMRNGEVHTTFRTDSSDLRAALATEWQSVTTQNQGDRSARLAPPVFTAGNGGSTADDSAYRQRQYGDHRPAPTFGGGSPSRSSGSVTAASATASPAARTTSANSIHLHTLA